MRKLILGLIFLCIGAVNSGCTGLYAAGIVTGAGQYIKYSLDCVASRTFMGDLQHLTATAVDVLKEMKMQVSAVEQTDEGRQIYAKVNNLNIRISLDPISENTTKVSIDVSKYKVLKDKATASAIISRINTLLTRTDRRLAKG